MLMPPYCKLQELGQVDGILSFWELSQPLVSRLAERLGLPANPPAAVDAAREKQVASMHLCFCTICWLEAVCCYAVNRQAHARLCSISTQLCAFSAG